MTLRPQPSSLAPLAVMLVIATGVAWAVNVPADPAPAHRRALVTLTGPHSKAARGIELARTEAEFIRLWQRHLGREETGQYSAHYNAIELPVIDFDRCQVLAIFDGPSWNSAGHRVESIFEQDGHTVLRYDAKSYQTSGPDGGVQKVSPYSFFVLSRQARTLRVEQDVQGRIGAPPKWKKMASFEPADPANK